MTTTESENIIDNQNSKNGYHDECDTQREKALLNEKKFVTARISDTCRFIGFGLLAAFYAIVSSGQAPVSESNASARIFLWIAGVCGLLTVFLDYLQYVAGFVATNKAILNSKGRYAYDRRWISYKMREFLFMAKQLTALSGGLAIAVFMIYIL